jgi:hypothetical protein
LHLPLQLVDCVCCCALKAAAFVIVLVDEADDSSNLRQHEQSTKAAPSIVCIDGVEANK